MAAPRNKRRYVRTRAQNLVAHLRVGDRTIQAPVDDISMGGMLARTMESIAIGTAVMFDLARPGLKKPLRLLGVVVDTRVGRGLGIRFDGLDRDGADRLGELIKDLGGMTSSLLVDKPDEAARPGTSPGMMLPQMPTGPAPATQTISTPFRTGLTGSFAVPTGGAITVGGAGGNQGASMASPPPSTSSPSSPPPLSQYTELELKLQAQMRSMVMELGRLQELVQQREKELHDARSEIDRLRHETASGDAAQRIVGKLEIEKNKLDGQLAELRTRTKGDADMAQREAEQAIGALGRMMEALKRLR